jgi:hypothetical protein
VLTEGPALLFALLGSLVWVEFLSQPAINLKLEPLGIAAGLSIGLAITCRQYYLALLPAMAVFALYQWRRRVPGARSVLILPTVLSLMAAMLPVLLLGLLWKSLSSPGMAPGNIYHHRTAIVGMNFGRPIVAAFYIALYALPLTFPAMLQLRSEWRWRALLIAVPGGLGATYFMSSLLQPGPFSSLIGTLARAPRSQSLLFGLVAVAVAYNFVAVCLLFWEQRTILLSSPLVIFSILVIVFFVAEQLGIQGNIYFYDRYVIQVAPFLGIVAFALLPELNWSRLLALGAMSVLGHGMLWRYALSG